MEMLNSYYIHRKNVKLRKYGQSWSIVSLILSNWVTYLIIITVPPKCNITLTHTFLGIHMCLTESIIFTIVFSKNYKHMYLTTQVYSIPSHTCIHVIQECNAVYTQPHLLVQAPVLITSIPLKPYIKESYWGICNISLGDI